MVHPIVMRIGASPMGRAGMAVFVILGLAAGAQGLVPWACSAGASICAKAEAENVPELLLAEDEPEAAAPSAEPVAAQPQAIPSSEIVMADASAAAAALASAGARGNMEAQMPAPLAAQGDLIAQTFASLSGRPLNGPTKRVVRTVPVNPDGTLAVAAAETPAEPVASVEPLVAASEEPAASVEPAAPVAVASAEPVAEESPSLAYAAGGNGDTATVLGAGANVRSKPQKGGSDVLFALRGGAEVTIVETSKGWMRVVDDRGRSGWVYGDYLRRE